MSTRKGQTPHAGHARTPPHAHGAARQAAPRPPAARPKSTPVAPPVYNPLPKPTALQTKTHAGQPVRAHGVQPRAASHERRTPTPPPVYRPEPKAAAQLKTAAPLRQNLLHAAQPTQLAQRSAAHAPQTRPQSAAQTKPSAQASNARPPSTPAQTLNALARAGVLQRTPALPARGPHAPAAQTQPRTPPASRPQTPRVSPSTPANAAHARTQRQSPPSPRGASLQLKPSAPHASPFHAWRGVIQRMEMDDSKSDATDESSDEYDYDVVHLYEPEETFEEEDVFYGGYETDVEGWQDYGSRVAKQGCKVHRLDKHKGPSSGLKLSQLYVNSHQVRQARSFDHDRYRQTLRWIATVLLAKYGGVEIQCYYHVESETLYISSNKDSVNETLASDAKKGILISSKALPSGRKRRHQKKLGRKPKTVQESEIKMALDYRRIVVPSKKYAPLDYHAERRIKAHLGVELDLNYLAGTRRACMSCAVDLGVPNNLHPGPIWTSRSGLGGFEEKHVKKQAEERGLYTYITYSRDTKKLTLDIGSDSDTSYESSSDSDDGKMK